MNQNQQMSEIIKNHNGYIEQLASLKRMELRMCLFPNCHALLPDGIKYCDNHRRKIQRLRRKNKIIEALTSVFCWLFYIKRPVPQVTFTGEMRPPYECGIYD